MALTHENSGESPSEVHLFLLTLPTVTSCISGQSLCIFILWSHVLCSVIFTGSARVFVLGAFVMHSAGGPMFNLSSGLNITAAIARGTRTCQPLYSVFVNFTPGHRLLSGEFSFEWKLSLKQGWLGSGRNQFLSPAALMLYLLCAEALVSKP